MFDEMVFRLYTPTFRARSPSQSPSRKEGKVRQEESPTAARRDEENTSPALLS